MFCALLQPFIPLFEPHPTPIMISNTAAQSQKTALFQSAAVNWESQYNPDDYSNIDVTMTLTPDTGSDTIRGRNLWRMGIYASDSPQGTGTKYGYQENILDQTAMQTPS